MTCTDVPCYASVCQPFCVSFRGSTVRCQLTRRAGKRTGYSRCGHVLDGSKRGKRLCQRRASQHSQSQQRYRSQRPLRPHLTASCPGRWYGPRRRPQSPQRLWDLAETPSTPAKTRAPFRMLVAPRQLVPLQFAMPDRGCKPPQRTTTHAQKPALPE